MIDLEKIYKISLIVLASVLVTFIGISAITYSANSTNIIYVSGSSTQDVSNQMADFTVTFTTENKDKAKSESDNNDKVTKFLGEVKSFGIEEKDITTQTLNVYQNQDSYYEGGVYKYKLGNWVYSQGISVKIREINKVNDFVNLAGANASSNIYGPNFSVDTEKLNDKEIYNSAFENAKQKAEGIAEKSGRKIGKAISISEASNSNNPMPLFPALRTQGAGGSSADLPSGSTSVSKTLNVVFELN
jgi:uncharacterized protein YggE